jgi:hypothetical protein
MIVTETVCWPLFKSVLSGLWTFAITILKMRSAGLGTTREGGRGVNSSAWGFSHSVIRLKPTMMMFWRILRMCQSTFKTISYFFILYAILVAYNVEYIYRLYTTRILKSPDDGPWGPKHVVVIKWYYTWYAWCIDGIYILNICSFVRQCNTFTS